MLVVEVGERLGVELEVEFDATIIEDGHPDLVIVGHADVVVNETELAHRLAWQRNAGFVDAEVAEVAELEVNDPGVVST
ncbi:hypothetical protein ACFQH6_19610 [Halobacteriaceae archaeon GCM10025711]